MKRTRLRMSILDVLALTLGLFVGQACNDALYREDKRTAGEPSAQESKNAATADSQSADEGKEGAEPTKYESAVTASTAAETSKPTVMDKVPNQYKEKTSQCLKVWGEEAPFDKDTSVRVIAAAVSVGGIGTTVKDVTVTGKPALIIIAAGVNVGSEVQYELLNPKGWYCMIANVNVGSDLSVQLKTGAHLLDSSVAVNVGSDGQGGLVNVNVGSHVEVNLIE